MKQKEKKSQSEEVRELLNSGANFQNPEESDYKKLMNLDPPEWALEEIEVIEDGQPKKVKVIKLNYVYKMLDLIYSNYDIEQKAIQQVGKAIVVVVRIWTVDKEGNERFRDGSGMVDASTGVKHGTARAEALAIKNAAKKLGRIFGRDLYANREDEKGEAPEEPKEAVKIDETSPRGRIIIQARKSKTLRSIQKVYETAKELVKNGEIDPDDSEVFEVIAEITEKIQKK